MEMAYHPRAWTGIADLAEGCGWRVILGSEAMVYQGFAQSSLWTGRGLGELPVDEVRRIIARKLEEEH